MMLRILPIDTTHLVLWNDFLDASECSTIRSAMDAGLATPAEIYDEGYRVDLDVRRTFEIEIGADVIGRVEAQLEAVRDEIGRAFGLTLTGAEGPGFLRYLSGGFYRAHQDTLDTVGDASMADSDRFPRRLSVVLFLTGSNEPGATPANACTGGALRLHGIAGDAAPFDLPPRRGMLAAFPSQLVHEVLPVTSGVRDVVVDWFY